MHDRFVKLLLEINTKLLGDELINEVCIYLKWVSIDEQRMTHTERKK